MKPKNVNKSSYLLKKGWQPEGNNFKDPLTGQVHSDWYAVKLQKQRDCWAKGKLSFEVREYRLGNRALNYGWVIEAGNKGKFKKIALFDDEGAAKRCLNRGYLNKEDILNTWDAIGEGAFLSYGCSYPYVLKFSEKYGDWHYHVPSPKAYFQACLEIALRRIGEGCWYYPSYDENLAQPPISLEEVEKWPDSGIKRAALEDWKWFKQNESYKKDDEKLAKLLKYIKNHKKDWYSAALAASELLFSRSDCEYEKVECIEMETVKV